MVQIDIMSASRLVGIVGVIAVLCAWIYIALTGEPCLQVRIADGTYANPCCGSLVLDNGTMTIANQRISYVIEQDKAGPYILPKTYVGASATGFIFKPRAYALKLSLDDPAHPRRVELLDDGPSGEAFSFVRKNDR